MKMLRKRFDCERYENSQANVSGRVYFSKAASRQCTDCISTITYFTRDSWKSSWCNSVLIK